MTKLNKIKCSWYGALCTTTIYIATGGPTTKWSKSRSLFYIENIIQSNNAVRICVLWVTGSEMVTVQWRIHPKYRPRQPLLKVTEKSIMEKKEFPLGKRKWIVTGHKSDCSASLAQTNTDSLKLCTLTSPVTGSVTISSSCSRYCNRAMVGNDLHGNTVW